MPEQPCLTLMLTGMMLSFNKLMLSIIQVGVEKRAIDLYEAVSTKNETIFKLRE